MYINYNLIDNSKEGIPLWYEKITIGEDKYSKSNHYGLIYFEGSENYINKDVLLIYTEDIFFGVFEVKEGFTRGKLITNKVWCSSPCNNCNILTPIPK